MVVNAFKSIVNQLYISCKSLLITNSHILNLSTII